MDEAVMLFDLVTPGPEGSAKPITGILHVHFILQYYSYMVLNKYQDTNNLIAEVQFLLFLRFLLWQSPAGHCRTASASAHH